MHYSLCLSAAVLALAGQVLSTPFPLDARACSELRNGNGKEDDPISLSMCEKPGWKGTCAVWTDRPNDLDVSRINGNVAVHNQAPNQMALGECVSLQDNLQNAMSGVTVAGWNCGACCIFYHDVHCQHAKGLFKSMAGDDNMSLHGANDKAIGSFRCNKSCNQLPLDDIVGSAGN